MSVTTCSFFLGLRQLIEQPISARLAPAFGREYLLHLIDSVSTRREAIAFLRQYFIRVMALPWQRTDIVSELCRSFSPSELEEAAIFFGVERVPAGFTGPGCVINRSLYRKVADHPDGAQLHYFGNWLVRAKNGRVFAYDYTHVVNLGCCDAQLHDVAYLTEPNRVYYSVVSVLQDDLSGYDAMRQAGLGDRIIQEVTRSLPASVLNLSESYLRPQQFNGDVLIDENDRWALVYNHYMGGAYTVLAKVREADLCEALSKELIPRRLSVDVKQLLRSLVADRFVEYANGCGRLPVNLGADWLQVVYNRERDGFVVYGAYADSPYDTIPFFCEYDYQLSLVENLTGLRKRLDSKVAQVNLG